MESLDTESIINHLQANWGLFEKNRIIPAYHYIGAAIQSYEEAVACANRIQWTIEQAQNNYQKAFSSTREVIFTKDSTFLPDIEIAGQQQKGIQFIREQRNNYFHYLRMSYDRLAFAAYQSFLRGKIKNSHPRVHEIETQIEKTKEKIHSTNHNPEKMVTTNTRKWFSVVSKESGEQTGPLLLYITDFDNRIKHEFPLATPYHSSFTLGNEIVYTIPIPEFKKNDRMHQEQDLLKAIPEFNIFMRNAIQQFIEAVISDQEKSSPYKNTFNGVILQPMNHEGVVPRVYLDSPVHDVPETIYVLGSARNHEEMEQLRKKPTLLSHVYLSMNGDRNIRYRLNTPDKNEYNIVDLSIPTYNQYSREK